MSFRFRHRAKFDVQALAAVLKLRSLRTRSPRQWNWAWPLHDTESASPSADSSAARNAWVSAVVSIAVSDDARALAFVSHDHGNVALLMQTGDALMKCKALILNEEIEKDAVATSLTFFNLMQNMTTPARALVAIGYNSGNIALFDVNEARLLAVTRPVSDLPVRRIRFYPAFHLLTSGPVHPAASTNSGLFVVLGWSGTVAKFPATDILALVSQADESGVVAKDELGGGWVVWNISSVQDAVLDAEICGSDPSSICELDIAPPIAPLRIAAVGVNPPIATYSATSDKAFSARDVAKRAATNIYSAARGFILSRITSAPDVPAVSDDVKKAITGTARFGTSWADDATVTQPLINLSDVRDTARKSVAAVLTRGRRPMDVDGTTAIDTYRRLSRGNGFVGQIARTGSASLQESDIARSAEMEIDGIMKKQRSRLTGEAVAHAARLSQKSRIIEQLAAAPLPASLIATSDTLGRVFIQDPRDLCVLRVLKGYREAQIAWLADDGPLLAVHAPRLNTLELHQPLKLKRIAAFMLDSGSMIVQSTSFGVFCVSADGDLYQLAKTRKNHITSSLGDGGGAKVPMEVPSAIEAEEDARVVRDASSGPHRGFGCSDVPLSSACVDHDSVGTFLESAKRNQTSVAVDCLQRHEDNSTKVAHLMAALVTCAQYVRTEVHVALASKAADIAAKLESIDLKFRFEAHGQLAEAFGLLIAEVLPEEPAVEERRVLKYGHRLLEDDIGSGLIEFALEELSHTHNRKGDRQRLSSNSDDDVMNCERFILCHELHPTTDLLSEVEYTIAMRRDLSDSEHLLLAKAYFSRLLEVDSVGVPTEGREHPAAKDVFFALGDIMKLKESEITYSFINFFLNMPLLTLLNTHSSIYASPLRCAILRMREYFSREEFELALLKVCETTSQVPNAVLFLRLYSFADNIQTSQASESSLEGCSRKLEEVLLYRKLVLGSAVPSAVCDKFTAEFCPGVPGDAERHAITCLVDWNDFDRASKILMGLDVSRKRQSLDWNESASVSEAALHACRKKSAGLITGAASTVIPESVVNWILAAKPVEQSGREVLALSKREGVLRKIRAVLLSAHQYFPDSSIDAVRCLQLAEAMSALIELEVRENGGNSENNPTATATRGGKTKNGAFPEVDACSSNNFPPEQILGHSSELVPERPAQSVPEGSLQTEPPRSSQSIGKISSEVTVSDRQRGSCGSGEDISVIPTAQDTLPEVVSDNSDK